MKRTISLPAATFAGLVTTGLLALPISSAFAADGIDLKRDDDGQELVMVADDDDDAGDDNTNTADKTQNTNSGTGQSNDNTGSAFTGISRDRDNSQGDKTKDWTKDGGDRTRDNSANQTNDRSRNDTRG